MGREKTSFFTEQFPLIHVEGNEGNTKSSLGKWHIN